MDVGMLNVLAALTGKGKGKLRSLAKGKSKGKGGGKGKDGKGGGKGFQKVARAPGTITTPVMEETRAKARARALAKEGTVAKEEKGSTPICSAINVAGMATLPRTVAKAVRRAVGTTPWRAMTNLNPKENTFLKALS